MYPDSRLPITAVVVTYNEDIRLDACLRSLRFCDEILVCDLGSTDESIQIGRRHADRHIQKPRVQFIEILWPDLFGLARNDWILRFDPDQVLPAGLIPGIEEAFRECRDASCIHLPLLYYFLNKPIFYSIWGTVRKFPLLLDRREVSLSGSVHEGIRFSDGRKQVLISGYDSQPIEHYWVDDIPQMIRKHLRYLRHEGPSRALRGQKFLWRALISDSRASLKANFVAGGCLRSGWRGYYLGLFHLFYVVGAHLSLGAHQARSSLRRKAGP